MSSFTSALSPLRADVYVAPPIPIVPPYPIPHNITPLWSPTTATLISSAHEAVLVDPLLTIDQAKSLADWIDSVIPNKNLTTIFVTHGHGDHFFGLPTLLDRFPNATPVATAGTVKHMQEQIESPSWENWITWFPGGQLRKPTSPPARALDPHDLTINLEGHKLYAVPAGHSDTDDSSFLWSPDLKLAVAGDIVYNDLFQYLAESLTPELRQKWVHAVNKVKSYQPETVVVGHKRPGAVDGSFTLDATIRYIETWGKLTKQAKTAEEMFDLVKKEYPNQLGDFILWWSSLAQFPKTNGTSNS